MGNKVKLNLRCLSIDHLDPTLSNYICGLDQVNNLRIIELWLNKIKSNAFVPYKLTGNELPPSEEGQTCCFLINGEWVWTDFCGDLWWREATRLGYSRTNRRGSNWYQNGEVTKMIVPGEPIPEGFVKGRIYSWQSPKGFISPIRGKKRAYNLETGEDGFYGTVPEGFISGVPPKKRAIHKPLSVCIKWEGEVCNWYNSGLTTREIAKIIGVSAPTINKLLKRKNISLRPIGGKRGKDLRPRKRDGYLKKSKSMGNSGVQ